MKKIRVCIVCSGNFPGGKENLPIYRAFIYDQAIELMKHNCEIEYFLIEGKGIKGYLKNASRLIKYLKKEKFDIVHAHSGLSGLLSALVVRIPLVITYHGSDINVFSSRMLSIFPIIRASINIFVSEKLKEKALFSKTKKNKVIPCGVDMNLFDVMPKEEAKKKLKINTDKKIVLFSSNFQNTVKNYPLAKQAIDNSRFDIEFLEIKNRTRQEVVWLLNSSDALIMTSHSEGSPQIIKEAMSCNCPIISIDVGDVKNRIESVKNSYIATPEELTKKLDVVLASDERSNGREHIQSFSNTFVAQEIVELYKKVL